MGENGRIGHVLDLPRSTWRAVEAEARRRDISPGLIVERAVRVYLAGVRDARKLGRELDRRGSP
jgi:hypothetical protein